MHDPARQALDSRSAAQEGPKTSASTYAWFNGAITERENGAPSVASISFHLGTGVFDGLMAYWNQDHYYLHRAEAHLERFRVGASRMGLEIPWSVDQMLAAIHELLSVEPPGTQYVRPIAYRRGPELWVTGSQHLPVDVSIFTVRVRRDTDDSLSCHVSPVERISSRAIPRHTKVCGAYVNSFNARRTAELAGFNDGIMLDREYRIAEASAANLFVILGQRLITPPLNPDVFPGVTRQVILELARDLGIDAVEANLFERDLVRIDAAFLCSTLMEIRGISRIGSGVQRIAARPLATCENPMFTALVRSFRKLTHQ
jgi:branched-chain amino acid aminotransferase